jgi:ribose 5-phosphate isomerase
MASSAVPAALSGVEAAKRAAAIRAVDTFVRDGMVVGIGSGSTVVYAVERLAERKALDESDELKISSATFVPTSFQSRKVCRGLPPKIPSTRSGAAPFGRGPPSGRAEHARGA